MKTIRMSGEGQVVVIYPTKNRVVEVLPLKFQGREKELHNSINSTQFNYWGKKTENNVSKENK